MTQALVRPGIVYAWYGPSLLIVTERGECADVSGLSGYYYREARFLRTWRLELNGEPPWLCESTTVAPDTLAFAYVYPEVAEYGGGGSGQSGDEEPTNQDGIPQRAVDIRVHYRLAFNSLIATASIGNRARRSLEFDVAWVFDADFVDIQEAQSGKPQQRAPVQTEHTGDRVDIAYAHDRLPYRTSIHLPDGWQAREGRAVTRLKLEPGQTTNVVLRVEATSMLASGAKLSATRFAPRAADLYMERWTFESQNTDTPVNGRADNLYQPVTDDGDERGRNWNGHTRETSIYTRAFLHPKAAAAGWPSSP